MAKNERTGKRVASKAGHARKDVTILRRAAKELRFAADNLEAIAKRYASVAGSALTQAPDQPRKVRRVTTLMLPILIAMATLNGCTREAAVNEFTVEHHEIPVTVVPAETPADRWDEIEYLCDIATPGPWTSDESIDPWMGGDFPAVRVGHITDQGPGYTSSGPVAMCPAEYGTGQPLTDARFIAAARTALPEAITRIRELEAEVAELRSRPVEQTTTGDASPIVSGVNGTVTIVTDPAVNR